MLFRKIESTIRKHLESGSDKIMIIEGARQIGKSYIIREVGKSLFPNFVEINLMEDKEGQRLFENVHTLEDFYLTVSIFANGQLGNKENTLIFLDEIQEYPQLLTLLKFLRQEGRYTYIASGSLLGLTLHKSTSIPIGSIDIQHMYPLDFEEFLIANGYGRELLDHIRKSFNEGQSLSEGLHTKTLDLFKKYLISGGLPDAVNAYLETHNIVEVRNIQRDIHRLYEADAEKYDEEHRLKIERLYRLIPSAMENKKKRIVAKNIEEKKGARFSTYQEEFDYLVDSGVALEVGAVTGPQFPLLESSTRNLIKLYLNDVGLLTSLLYGRNIKAILDDERSVNLGAVYESVVAQELYVHGFKPFYYDNKKNGEVDFLIDNYDTLSVMPLEIKSGKDYKVHSALSRFVENRDYNVKEAIVFSNAREVSREGKITYLPIYYVMWLQPDSPEEGIYF